MLIQDRYAKSCRSNLLSDNKRLVSDEVSYASRGRWIARSAIWHFLLLFILCACKVSNQSSNDGNQPCSEGSFLAVDGTCHPWTTCAPGSFVTFAGSAIADRTCGACPSGTFSSSSNTSQCTTWTTCTAGPNYMTTPPSSTSDRICGTCSNVVINSHTLPTYTSADNAPSCCTYAPMPSNATVLVNSQFGDPMDNNGAEYAAFGSPPCPGAGCILTSSLSAAVPNYTLAIPPEPAGHCSASYTYLWDIRFPPALGSGSRALQSGRQLGIAPNSLPNAGQQLWTAIVTINNTTTGEAVQSRFRFVYDSSTLSTGVDASNNIGPGKPCANPANSCACGICGTNP